MTTKPSPIAFLRMILAQQMGKHVLARRPEPAQITDATENVVQYDRVMGTKLAIAYAAGLETLYRLGPATGSERVVDLACGPGHYTLCLAQYLGYEHVQGIDLSPRMVRMATENATQQGYTGRVEFRVGDVTRLHDIPNAQLDVASFTDAAHHMPDLETVERVLREMNRVTKPGGVVMVMDLVRLRTTALTEHYVQTLGHDYVDRGLPAFYEDFRNSMYAAWTAKELRQAIPRDTPRCWCHIVPRGLPTIQIVLGLPIGRSKPFVRRGLPWKPENCPVSKEMRFEWRMLRLTLALASGTIIPPRQP